MTHPLDDEVFRERESQLSPFLEVLDRNFTQKSDATVGAWHNYFIGIVGGVASAEHEVLWPNRVSLLDSKFDKTLSSLCIWKRCEGSHFISLDVSCSGLGRLWQMGRKDCSDE